MGRRFARCSNGKVPPYPREKKGSLIVARGPDDRRAAAAVEYGCVIARREGALDGVSKAGQEMVVIRGRVDPGRALNGSGRWRHLMGLGRWHLEYTARDSDGQIIEKGTFKADLNGCFVVGIEGATSGTVEIRVKGRAAETDDSCTVRISSASDVINLPRRLYPYNGHVGTVPKAV